MLKCLQDTSPVLLFEELWTFLTTVKVFFIVRKKHTFWVKFETLGSAKVGQNRHHILQKITIIIIGTLTGLHTSKSPIRKLFLWQTRNWTWPWSSAWNLDLTPLFPTCVSKGTNLQFNIGPPWTWQSEKCCKPCYFLLKDFKSKAHWLLTHLTLFLAELGHIPR